MTFNFSEDEDDDDDDEDEESKEEESPVKASTFWGSSAVWTFSFLSLTNSLLFVTGQANTIQKASPRSEWQES